MAVAPLDRETGPALSELPVATFTTWGELKRELALLLQGQAGTFTVDRHVDRDTRQVIYVHVAGEEPELFFQIRVKAVMLRDGEYGCRGVLCDDKSRLLIARHLKNHALGRQP